MSKMKRFFVASAFVGLAAVAVSGPSFAAKDNCGQPVSNGATPVATDCLFILNAAVGLQTCAFACTCDVNGSSGNPNATDALVCLNAAVGVQGVLNCSQPCPPTTLAPPKNTCSEGEFIAAAGSDLDAGWNGAGHNASITEGASIFINVLRRCGGDGAVCLVDADCTGETCDLTCDCDSTTDTVCEITGPVGDKHCLVSMNQTCTDATDCPTGETCQKFFGPPLSLSAEGTPTCITTYFQEDISGTADTATGTGEAAAFLRSRVHLGIATAKPCPSCGSLAQNPAVGDTFTCSGGSRNGQPCTVGAINSDFGGTSFDCPPDSNTNVSGVGLAINFSSISTGTRTRNAVLPCGGSLAALHPSNGGAICLDTFVPCSTNADCMRCTGSPTTACASNTDCTGNGSCAEAPDQPISCGVYCQCGFCDSDPDAPCAADSDCDPGQTCEQGTGATQQLQGNKCTDLICGLGGEELCCSSDTPNCANPTAKVGQCTLANYLSCNNNADCSSQGAGNCTLTNRPCFENQISRTGSPSPLGSYCVEDPAVTTCTSNADCAVGNCVPESSEPTTVALFCIPPTASASINAAGGIPGPGAISFKAAILTYRCGNLVLEGVEQCDDGNNVNGDGCDEICRTE